MNATVMGIATALNVIVVVWKLRNGRAVDGIVDGILLAGIMYVFMGSVSGLQMGTIGSAMVSIYLLFDPIKVDLSPTISAIKYVVLWPFVQLNVMLHIVINIVTYPFRLVSYTAHAIREHLVSYRRQH